MIEELNIVKYVSIKNGKIAVNGELVFESTETEFAVLIKEMYKSLDDKYMKFFKMDSLCKLAYVAGEYLLKGVTFNRVQETAVILTNKAASIDTDRKHQLSIDNRDDYFPSPAVFVYTLANIMLGEICIKHKLQGENACFITEQFDANLCSDYVQMLFKKGDTKQCLVGWVDFDNNEYDAFMVLVDKNNSKNITFETNNLLKLYNE
jgi:hypothetical protein